MKKHTLIFAALLLMNTVNLLGESAVDYYNRGIECCKISRYEEALQNLSKAEKKFTIENNQQGKGVTLNSMAMIYMSQRKYNESLKCFTECLNIFRNIGDKEYEMFALTNIGLLYELMGKPVSAIRFFKDALPLARSLKNMQKEGKILNKLGNIYHSLCNYNEAIKYYKKGLPVAKKNGYRADEAAILGNIGGVYDSWGQYDKALRYYNEGLRISKEIKDRKSERIMLNNIGAVYRSRGRYDEALRLFTEGLNISRKTGEKESEELALNNIGLLLDSWGKYDEALKYLSDSLKISREIRDRKNEGMILNNIGNVYKSWGKYDEAIKYYNKSLMISRETGNRAGECASLNCIGAIKFLNGRHDDALKCFSNSLNLCREIGDRVGESQALNNIANIYNRQGKYNEAVKKYNESLKISREIGDVVSQSIALNNIGDTYETDKNYSEAVKYYTDSLNIYKQLKDRAGESTALSNIGCVKYKQNKFDEAIKCFNKSIVNLEGIRKTAPGEIKIDYLSSVLGTYQWLIKTYIGSKNPVMAMNTKEQSSARYLAEKLAERRKIGGLKPVSITDYRKKMDKDTIVVSFANSDMDKIAVLSAAKNTISAVEVNIKDFIKKFYNINSIKIKQSNNKNIKSRFGMSQEKKQVLDGRNGEDRLGLDVLINFYREMLQNPEMCKRTKAGQSDFELLSKKLYTLLLKPVEPYLSGKKNIVIIPDGILGFLPFETLIDESGKYLIEKYNISYTQSLTVSEILAKRKYSKNKNNILAFGGAVYNERTYAGDMKRAGITNKMIAVALRDKRSMRKSYDSLGYTKISNLPGTLAEVLEIGSFMKGANIVIKDKVEESNVKKMSETGELKKYNVIHFATHGIVVPQTPELSAVVLSQFKKERNGEDGFLNMGEVLNLEIECDFVNLSACETGLGRIAGGEGIVGLTQSFLLTGANGISVSLWSVADESTKEFMVGLYRLVKDKNISYRDAMIEMKRKFITDKKWNSPYYWAPFVYYGK